jgi:streptogramin lyase
MGSAVHIGLIKGGTRSNSDGTPNPAGAYLAPPFEVNNCVDRDGDGLYFTSLGDNDVKPWTNAAGADTLGGVSTAADECILHHTRTNATGTRHISVDSTNNVWVSGTGSWFSPRGDFDLISGSTGSIIRQEPTIGMGGYGGLIDGNGVIWSATTGGTGMLRWDTSTALGVGGVNINIPSYGLCIDSSGQPWTTGLWTGNITKLSPAGAVLGIYSYGGNGNAQGCAVDQNDDVWVAHSLFFSNNTIGHMKNVGTFVGNVTLSGSHVGPTGVSVDANNKVWVTGYSDRKYYRVDPALSAGLGAVDFSSVDTGAHLYNYSDMTGSTLTAPPGNGSWSVIHDSGVVGSEWGEVSWNSEPEGDTPGDSTLTVTVASSADGVTFGPTETATNGGDLSVADNQYLKVTVSFTRSSSDDDGDGFNDSPILSDLTIAVANEPPVCTDAAPSVASLWPPNHKMQSISIEGVTDEDGDPITITIDSITQDEPVLGQGDGNFAPDGFGVGASTAEVRAERTGVKGKKGSNGRVYEIGFTADDGNGGTCSGSVNVGVPHDQKPGNDPVDDDQIYDSTVIP